MAFNVHRPLVFVDPPLKTVPPAFLPADDLREKDRAVVALLSPEIEARAAIHCVCPNQPPIVRPLLRRAMRKAVDPGLSREKLSVGIPVVFGTVLLAIPHWNLVPECPVLVETARADDLALHKVLHSFLDG